MLRFLRCLEGCTEQRVRYVPVPCILLGPLVGVGDRTGRSAPCRAQHAHLRRCTVKRTLVTVPSPGKVTLGASAGCMSDGCLPPMCRSALLAGLHRCEPRALLDTSICTLPTVIGSREAYSTELGCRPAPSIPVVVKRPSADHSRCRPNGASLLRLDTCVIEQVHQACHTDEVLTALQSCPLKF